MFSLYGGVAQIYPDIYSGVRTQAAAAAAAAQCICMHEDSKQQQIKKMHTSIQQHKLCDVGAEKIELRKQSCKT